jgi:hypothetical protein
VPGVIAAIVRLPRRRKGPAPPPPDVAASRSTKLRAS